MQSADILESSHLNSHLFITAIILTLIITILLLGIFVLLAIAIVKKIPYNKNIRNNRIIQHSMKENAIIRLWKNNSSIQMPLQSQDKQLVSLQMANKTNVIKEDNEQINELNAIQDKLLSRRCSCPTNAYFT